MGGYDSRVRGRAGAAAGSSISGYLCLRLIFIAQEGRHLEQKNVRVREIIAPDEEGGDFYSCPLGAVHNLYGYSVSLGGKKLQQCSRRKRTRCREVKSLVRARICMQRLVDQGTSEI